ncbi:MAG TPA: RluA family pseudouridine synthase [Longimicrobium sp.]|nr:RluA family pseudouridine synthase [Longimicrobium sp.]
MKPSDVAPVPMALDVVHEDAALLVVNKPAGMLVHPVTAGATETLANGIAHHFASRGVETRIHLVHRLDRDTSGLVLVAKDAATHARLDRQLRARTLRRGYLALADGVLADDEGVIDAPIGRDPDDPPLRAVREDGAPARTRFRVVERCPAATLVALELETGRTHQVRVHLAHLGHPVLGDRWYGRRGLDLISRQALHAARLALTHPFTGETIVREAPLPPDMAALRERLRG